MDNSQLRRLFAGIRNGSETDFETLYEDMKTPVFTVIYRMLGSIPDAEDVTQEVFVKLFCDPPAENVKNIRAWIFTVAHNMAVDRIRVFNKTAVSDAVEDFRDNSDDFLLPMEIENAMRQLSDEEREIVAMHINAGLKHREIAEILKIPLGTVLWKYRKALDKLKNYLTEEPT